MTIRRTALVDAPIDLVRAYARNLADAPQFSHGLAPENASALSSRGSEAAATGTLILEREEERLFVWEDGGAGHDWRLTVTLAPLAGETTWVTWMLDVEQELPGRSGGEMGELAEWLGRSLEARRDEIEREYHAARKRLAGGAGARSGAKPGPSK